jgi:hypothetical protein
MSLRQKFKDHALSFAAGAAPLAVFNSVMGMGLSTIPSRSAMGALLALASYVSYRMADKEIGDAFKQAVESGRIRKKAGTVLAGALAACLVGLPFIFKAARHQEQASAQRKAQAAQTIHPGR